MTGGPVQAAGPDTVAAIPTGVATGIGSWPGTDELEAARLISGELEHLPHLVELPDRGLGADLIGRTAGMLVDLPVDVSTTGYRLTDRPGAILSRARAHLRRDLDAIEEVWETTGLRGAGTTIKVQAAGPVTMAAQIELPGGRRALTDPGAITELTDSLAEGLAEHVAEVARRLGAAVIVQLDEPELPAALAGAVPGMSRFDSVPALPGPDAVALIDRVGAVAGAPTIVHSCAAEPPLDLLREATIAGVAIDLAQLTTADLDAVGNWLETGRVLFAGTVATGAPAHDRADAGLTADPRRAGEPVVALLDRLGFDRSLLTDQLVFTPACGLAGADPAAARRILDEVVALAAAVRGGDFQR